MFCFSNEFSSFSHKTVYFDFQNGQIVPLSNMDIQQGAMTQLETSAVNIHEALKVILIKGYALNVLSLYSSPLSSYYLSPCTLPLSFPGSLP